MVNKFNLNCNKNNFAIYDDVKSKCIVDNGVNLKPLVSIMIPTFKRPLLLKDAIDSAFNQQTDKYFEVVVVDNDSDGEFSNEIEALINTYYDKKIRYFRNDKNIGMFGNWNRCIELARADWYTILNDDDLLHPEFIENMMSNIINDSSIELISTNSVRFTELDSIKDKLDGKLQDEPIIDISVRKLLWGPFANGTLGTLYKKENAINLGGYDEALYPTSDYIFTVKYCSHYNSKLIKNRAAYMRWLDNESMKERTIRGFIHNDHMFWKEIRKALYLEKKINYLEYGFYSYLSRVKIIMKLYTYSKLASVPVSELNEGFPLKVSKIEYLGDYFFVRFQWKLLTMCYKYSR